MLLYKTSRRRAAPLLAVVLLGTGACSADEPEMVMQGSIVLGHAWKGPEKNLYSQGNEELIVRDFFEDRRGGVFLDVGSADPVESSTTYYLERHLDWTGVAVDAQAHYAPAYAAKRPSTRFASYIVTDESGTRQKFYRVRALAGLSSVEPDRRWGGESLKTDTIDVPTITLDALLAAQGVSRLDFVSMDIEGGEAKALAGFDIERFRPELVCIEVERDNREAVADYFAARGYVRLERYDPYDFVNHYYTPAQANGGDGGA